MGLLPLTNEHLPHDMGFFERGNATRSPPDFKVAAPQLEHSNNLIIPQRSGFTQEEFAAS
jgi:hypothetical protein